MCLLRLHLHGLHGNIPAIEDDSLSVVRGSSIASRCPQDEHDQPSDGADGGKRAESDAGVPEAEVTVVVIAGRSDQASADGVECDRSDGQSDWPPFADWAVHTHAAGLRDEDGLRGHGV